MSAPGTLQQVGVISPPIASSISRAGIRFPIDSSMAPYVLVVHVPVAR